MSSKVFGWPGGQIITITREDKNIEGKDIQIFMVHRIC